MSDDGSSCTDSACGDAHTQDRAPVPRIGESEIHLASGFSLGLTRIAPRCRTAPGTATMTFQPGLDPAHGQGIGFGAYVPECPRGGVAELATESSGG
jgi:hypothetical protein